MLVFQVKDMTCGHCVATLTKALNAADPDATVDISVQERLVRVQPAQAGASELQSAIEKAGYTPVLLPEGFVTAPAARKAGGCCCASR
jgi:copper chaperone